MLLAAFDPGSQLASVFLGLLAFCAILVCAWFLLRLLRGRGGLRTGSSGMQVLDRLALSPAASLLVVRVGEKVLLLSAGKDTVSFVAELNPADLPGLAAPRAQGPDMSGFWSRFLHNLLYNMGFRSERAFPPQPGGETENKAGEASDAIREEALRKIFEAQQETQQGAVARPEQDTAAALQKNQPAIPEEPHGETPRVSERRQTNISQHTPTPGPNFDGGSGQSYVRPVSNRSVPDYHAALENMRHNAQLESRPVQKTSMSVKQAAETPVITPEETAVRSAASAEGDEKLQRGAAPTETASFAEVLSQATGNLPPVTTPSPRIVRDSSTGSLPAATPPARAAHELDTGGTPAAEGELDALFEKIAQRRERMSNKSEQRKG